MKPFLRWSATFLLISLLLNGMMVLQNRAALRLFRTAFPGRTAPNELDTEELQQWASMCEARFQNGPWRWLTVIYMFFHYPGIALNAMRDGNSVSTATMFIASLVAWIPIIALITKPWRG